MKLIAALKKLLHISPGAASEALGNIFFEKFAYRFQDGNLLLEALTHRSYIHVVDNAGRSSERLEFLGDSVLGVIIAEYLFKENPQFNEGDLTKTKALLVNENTLFMVGQKSGLNKMILMSPDEDKSGGRQRPSIISDAVEAVIGAIFLDGGVDPARNFIRQLIITEAREIVNDIAQRNYKGDLLEYMQRLGSPPPYYEVVSEEGPDHDKIFNVQVKAGPGIDGFGRGASKKEAEQQAAQLALENIEKKQKTEKPTDDD